MYFFKKWFKKFRNNAECNSVNHNNNDSVQINEKNEINKMSTAKVIFDKNTIVYINKDLNMKDIQNFEANEENIFSYIIERQYHDWLIVLSGEFECGKNKIIGDIIKLTDGKYLYEYDKKEIFRRYFSVAYKKKKNVIISGNEYILYYVCFFDDYTCLDGFPSVEYTCNYIYKDVKKGFIFDIKTSDDIHHFISNSEDESIEDPFLYDSLLTNLYEFCSLLKFDDHLNKLPIKKQNIFFNNSKRYYSKNFYIDRKIKICDTIKYFKPHYYKHFFKFKGVSSNDMVKIFNISESDSGKESLMQIYNHRFVILNSVKLANADKVVKEGSVLVSLTTNNESTDINKFLKVISDNMYRSYERDNNIYSKLFYKFYFFEKTHDIFNIKVKQFSEPLSLECVHHHMVYMLYNNYSIIENVKTKEKMFFYENMNKNEASVTMLSNYYCHENGELNDNIKLSPFHIKNCIDNKYEKKLCKDHLNIREIIETQVSELNKNYYDDNIDNTDNTDNITEID